MKQLYLLLLLVALAGCGSPPAGAGSPRAAGSSGNAAIAAQAWIDAPLDGSELPFGPVAVTAHVYHPAGIGQIELSVDGAVVSTTPSQNAATGAPAFQSIELPWQPAAPAIYRLAVRAQNPAGDWGNPAFATVSITGAADLTAAAPPTSVSPTPTPAETPTPASATLTPAPSLSAPAATTAPPASASPATNTPLPPTDAPIRATDTPPPPTDTPEPVRVTDVPPRPTDTPLPPPSLSAPTASTTVFNDVAGCGPPTEITVNIAANNLGGGGSAAIFYRVAGGRWLSQAMNNVSGTIWSRTLHAGAEVPEAPTGPFEYYVVASAGDGQTAQSEIYGGIEYGHCKP